MVRDPKHDSTLQRVVNAIQRRLSEEWQVRIQSATTMDDGEPEPDIAVVPGPIGRFHEMHPRPFDVVLLVEISNTTIGYDRGPKLRDYARNSIERYWVVNIEDRQVEEYTESTGPTDLPQFRSRRNFREGESVPLILRNQTFQPVPVSDLMPRNPSLPT